MQRTIELNRSGSSLIGKKHEEEEKRQKKKKKKKKKLLLHCQAMISGHEMRAGTKSDDD